MTPNIMEYAQSSLANVHKKNITIKSKNLISMEELKSAIATMYSLERNLNLELLMSISHHVSIKRLLIFFQELQSHLGEDIECQFYFKITKKPFCETKLKLYEKK